MGMVSRRAGSIRYEGSELSALPSNRIARLGLAICPEERGIFASLNVEENLLLPPVVSAGGLGIDSIFGLFPNLQERLRSQGTKLSGGEQQMLAIARILRTGARFLLLDEPTEGLAPVIVQQIGRPSGGSRRGIHHPPRRAESRSATVAERHYGMERGRVVDMLANAALDASMDKLHEYLGV
jgi:branched-chain amino acid transport system ATP-binding protein